MSSVVGDIPELSRPTITAKATHSVTGADAVFHFKLSEAPGIKKYFSSHAKVVITGPVLVGVSGPVTASTAIFANVAVVPDKYATWPSKREHVIQLQGSVEVQHSLLVPQQNVPVEFGNETTEQLKPNTLVDYPPVVVGHVTVAGGDKSSVSTIVVTVPLLVEGVAHHRTW